jgi:hypothetical protein
MITIQAMLCSNYPSILAREKIKNVTFNLEEFNDKFNANCIILTDVVDVRPTIYINDAHAYFNISSSLTVKNLRFTGIN